MSVTSQQQGAVTEYFLPQCFSQYTIDGRNGSSACTVISTLVAKAILTKQILLPRYGPPDAASLSRFIDVIREGNLLYDSSALEKKAGLLALYDVLHLWPQLGVKVIRGGDLGFRSASTCKEMLTPILERLQVDADIPAAGVLIACPYSISVTLGNGRMAVWDSHIHGKEGTLVALSFPSTTPDTMADYLSTFLFRHFNIQLEDAQLCLLEFS